jgi:hypothetical protein
LRVSLGFKQLARRLHAALMGSAATGSIRPAALLAAMAIIGISSSPEKLGLELA